MLVRDVMSTEVETVGAETSIFEAKRALRERGIRHLPVVDDDGNVIGVVSQTDLVAAAIHVADGVDDAADYLPCLDSTAIRPHISRPAVTIPPTATVEAAAGRLREKRVGCLCVLEGRRLVGILTEVDLIDALVALLVKARDEA